MLELAGFHHLVSLSVFRFFASMQRFESARRLHLLRIMPVSYCASVLLRTHWLTLFNLAEERDKN
jgi:hypothetical protein